MADTITTWTPISAPTDFRDDAVFDIDSKTKSIQVLVEQPIVAGEHKSQFIKFQMGRYYDAIDLTAMQVNIVFLSPAGNRGISEAVNTEYSDDAIRFGWLVPYAACPEKGKLYFAVEFVGADYTLKTTAGCTQVLDSISDRDIVPEPVEQEWYIVLQANVATLMQEAQRTLGRVEGIFNALGTPLSANTVAEMTEESAIYVYTGSEPNYEYGYWYYHDGTGWVPGSEYASTALVTDSTLSKEGQAADAKAVSVALAEKADKDRTPHVVTPEEAEADLYFIDEQGNVIAEFINGHFRTKYFDSSDIKVVTDPTVSKLGKPADAKAVGDRFTEIAEDIQAVEESIPDVSGFADVKTPQETTADLFICDSRGNVLVELKDGHIVTKNFDSADVITEDDITDLESAVSDLSVAVSRATSVLSTTEQNVDLDVVDASGNVILRLVNGHIQTKNFDSSRSDQNAVLTVNNTAPDANGNVNVRAELDPEDIAPAVEDYLNEHPVVASGGGVVSVADYGAVGDGVTDDSHAIQEAVNSNYDVYFESDKTYFLGSTVTINHDIKLHGGKNTAIKTATPENSAPYDGIRIAGTLKKTTTLTSNYYSKGTSDADNISNRLTLADMSNVAIGDVIVIKATDQYYALSRAYYYLGATLLVTDIYDGHIYVNRDMPYDITLTEHVTVYVYSPVTAKISNLTFVSDTNAFGGAYFNSYASLIHLQYGKNCEINGCDINNFKIGIKADYCVNILVDGITMSKSRWENTSGMGDGYGLEISSCTNTTIRRVIALCSQGCIDISGDVPSIDTLISMCNLASECRATGLDLHENSYNLVVEDCVLAGAGVTGTVTINRCRFVRNVRGGGYGGLVYRGLHEAKYSKITISDCVFPVEASCYISIKAQAEQSGYISAYDNIIGSVIIKNCFGGGLNYEVSTGEVVLSSVVEKLILQNWTQCYEFYHSGDGTITDMEITDCDFITPYYVNSHAGAFNTSGINNLVIQKTVHNRKVMHINKIDTWGEMFYLPEGIEISVSSDNANAEYIVCGENLASNNHDDYNVGSVSGNVGASLVRTVDTTASSMLTTDSSGNLVYTVPSGYTSKKAIMPKCFVCDCANEPRLLRASATLKNTGNTDGSTFYFFVAVINKETGYLTYRNAGSAVNATIDGAVASYSHEIPAGHVGYWYIAPSTVVSGSETTFENLIASMTPYDDIRPSYTEYNGNKVTGNGTLTSISGKNYIQSSEQNFDVQFIADYTR